MLMLDGKPLGISPDALSVLYDDSKTQLGTDNVQGAISELNTNIKNIHNATFTTNYGNIYVFKRNGILTFYGFLKDLPTNADVFDIIKCEKPMQGNYNVFPVYGSDRPYSPIGSSWVRSDGYISIYKPLNITALYISGTYAYID